jgi:hypothetical protein
MAAILSPDGESAGIAAAVSVRNWRPDRIPSSGRIGGSSISKSPASNATAATAGAAVDRTIVTVGDAAFSGAEEPPAARIGAGTFLRVAMLTAIQTPTATNKNTTEPATAAWEEMGPRDACG